MITASTYTLVVVPLVVIALAVGAVLWSNASARQFDRARPMGASGGSSVPLRMTELTGKGGLGDFVSDIPTAKGEVTPPALKITTAGYSDEYMARMKAATVHQTTSYALEGEEHEEHDELAQQHIHLKA